MKYEVTGMSNVNVIVSVIDVRLCFCIAWLLGAYARV